MSLSFDAAASKWVGHPIQKKSGVPGLKYFKLDSGTPRARARQPGCRLRDVRFALPPTRDIARHRRYPQALPETAPRSQARRDRPGLSDGWRPALLFRSWCCGVGLAFVATRLGVEEFAGRGDGFGCRVLVFPTGGDVLAAIDALGFVGAAR